MANGYADRITFHQTLSSAITLPQPADVIVSDLRGVLPLMQHHIPAIVDARQRLLAPGGVLIPRAIDCGPPWWKTPDAISPTPSRGFPMITGWT
jgi:hypothetical protein